MRKCLKVLAVVALLSAVLAVAAFFIMRAGVIARAEARAAALWDTVDPALTGTERLFQISAAVSDSFVRDTKARPLAIRVRPYVTHEFLPSFVRLPEGVIETLYPAGWCDEAARYLMFVLAQRDIHAVQWNMVTPASAHSAVRVVDFQGQDVFIDPYYSLMGLSDDTGAAPEDIQALIATGLKPDAVFRPLVAAHYKPSFYEDMGQAVMGRPEDHVVIAAHMALTADQTIEIGRRNDNQWDVHGQGGRHGISPFWHYVGHKYNRQWERHLSFSRPVRVTMHLTQPVFDGALAAALTAPDVSDDGLTLVWDIGPGESLSFKDGAARRSWTRLKSYVPVDQIVIEAANGADGGNMNGDVNAATAPANNSGIMDE